ncbi:MAG TPA: MBOAT family O-acyltransferase [Candidatus Paceibacterota bacterium]
MIFNSLAFLIFFPVATLVYFLIPHRLRWVWLLAISVYFYISFVPVYILILLTTITIDFFSGILIENAKNKKRKLYLLISILANGGILFFFKYFNFFNENLSVAANFLNVGYEPLLLNIILPIGLSFHVFQSMSYTIEVYRNNQKAERNFGILALYVLFYPQLVAGPIERPQNLLHQFYERHEFDIKRVGSGLALMLGGFLKKIVIADRLALFVNPVFSNVSEYSGISFVIAGVFFTIQIYCDFSGYSNIAVGSARVMGFNIMQNFERPFFAKSIAKFWNRWHISLSTWLRDYLYYPLVFSFKEKTTAKLYLASLITFTLIGLWHGANWTFVIFGAIHGVYLIVGQTTKKFRARIMERIGITKWTKIHHVLQSITVFGLFSLSLIFFRANTLTDAIYILKNLFSGWSTLVSNFLNPQFLNQYIFMGFSKGEFYLSLFLILVLTAFELFQQTIGLKSFIARKPAFWGAFIFALGILSLLIFGRFGGEEFIYFQF